jgi:hypothetical protein
MLSRSKMFAAALTGGALLAAGSPAHALYAPAIAPFLDTRGGDTAAGACSFLLSGPSLSPSSTPFHVVGTGTIESTRVVVSTSIRCKIVHHSTGAQVGGVLQQALFGNSSATAGDINVSDLSAAYDICTMIDAVYSDTSHFNPGEVYQCRPLQSIAVKA